MLPGNKSRVFSTMRCFLSLFATVIVVFLLSMPLQGRAQFGALESAFNGIFGGGLPQPTLVVEPQFPGAAEQVTASIPDTISDVSGGIRWTVNGQVRPEFENERSITLTTGALGETISFSATVTNRSGAGQTLSQAVTPIDLDIVIEGKTIVPKFYEGRALPSRGAEVLLTAIPQTGTPVSHEDFSYRWQIGNTVVDSGIVKGRFQQLIEMPVSRPELVKVDVFGSENNLLVSKTFELAFFDPEFRFYEASPLLGLSPVELGVRTLPTDAELVIRAEPYFFDPKLLAFEHQFRWDINGKALSSDPGDELEATVNISGNGSARVNASLRSRAELLQHAEGRTIMRFGEI